MESRPENRSFLPFKLGFCCARWHVVAQTSGANSKCNPQLKANAGEDAGEAGFQNGGVDFAIPNVRNNIDVTRAQASTNKNIQRDDVPKSALQANSKTPGNVLGFVHAAKGFGLGKGLPVRTEVRPRAGVLIVYGIQATVYEGSKVDALRIAPVFSTCKRLQRTHVFAELKIEFPATDFPVVHVVATLVADAKGEIYTLGKIVIKVFGSDLQGVYDKMLWR